MNLDAVVEFDVVSELIVLLDLALGGESVVGGRWEESIALGMGVDDGFIKGMDGEGGEGLLVDLLTANEKHLF